MTSPSLFTELFAHGSTIPDDRLDGWFDQKTQTFGGQDAINTVRSLIGNFPDWKLFPLRLSGS